MVLTSRAAFAQAARPWPRNAATGKIEFTGRLPWPDSVRTEAQRQLLVRRWYRRKLTNDQPEMIRRFVQESGTTYSQIPAESCYRLSIMNRDEEHFSLCFQLRLTSDNTGLSYRFFDFDYNYFSFDNGGDYSLESLLTPEGASPRSIIESFHEQLLAATKAW
ncbi:hypothetical protein J4D99_03875 [Siccationidurans ginsengisoli]|uniref:hypothetical protein n=1 Tax=Hymenobacter TaxID=89966 RepID=UPI001AAD7395|nr:hypothetical protein [Hymenobacter sp. BT559]MBO2030521.1 hypothetical protein [Hymenobacter sp. BT559]